MRSVFHNTCTAIRSTTKLRYHQHYHQHYHRHPHQTSTSETSTRQCSTDHISDVSQKETTRKGDTILVTGGNGFLGQHVIKHLQENAPHVGEIRVLDLWPFTAKLDYDAEKPMTSYTGSVTDNDALQRAMWDVDGVIHIAGLISYGTFPDFKGMERVNVDGTLNVIRACLRQNVTRLLYCSSVDVVIGFQPIRGGGEDDTPVPPEFLFPGYPESKLQGERLVLSANGQPCDNGNTLHTLSLRANVMYGELDPYYVTTGFRNAASMGGKLIQVGNGEALFQQCYVGNSAAAFVQADAALSEKPNIGGQAFFIPDDTPLQNSFKFMEPFLESRGFSLSQTYIPYSLVYWSLYATEMVLKALSPLVKIQLKTASCSIQYINMDLYFRNEKARSVFGFTPVYSPSEAKERSLVYYKSVKL